MGPACTWWGVRRPRAGNPPYQSAILDCFDHQWPRLTLFTKSRQGHSEFTLARRRGHELIPQLHTAPAHINIPECPFSDTLAMFIPAGLKPANLPNRPPFNSLSFLLPVDRWFSLKGYFYWLTHKNSEAPKRAWRFGENSTYKSILWKRIWRRNVDQKLNNKSHSNSLVIFALFPSYRQKYKSSRRYFLEYLWEWMGQDIRNTLGGGMHFKAGFRGVSSGWYTTKCYVKNFAKTNSQAKGIRSIGLNVKADLFQLIAFPYN